MVQSGTRIGPYEIVSLLGRGGMGEVYRARDTKLDRDVAIKVLPELFVSDPERVARFQREAKTLAALNHPHIGGIYGLEDADGVHALVLELVEGPTLADRIAQGPIPLDEALPIAKQIAEALEAAHEAAIIHRDLKPANIKLRPDGTVKVLDFGLAKAMEPSIVVARDVTASPTITSPAMTQMGVILGTAAYMSPEQAKGRPADKRSDVWAFGCVLYEMLTGNRAFSCEDVSDTLASVLRSEPNWSALPTNTPFLIRRLLRLALEKDARARVPHIGVARMEIDEIGKSTGDDTSVTVSAARSRFFERLVWSALLAVVGLVAIGATLRTLRPTNFVVETRLDIATPPTTDPVSIAISPDGRKVVYVASLDSRSQLWLRELNAAAPRPLARTEGATFPFWSPDSQSIAFFANGQLARIDLNGGAVRALTRVSLGRGGAWSADGTIIFAPSALAGLLRTTSGGGDPQVLTTLSTQEASHTFPQFLPDNHQFLYFVAGSSDVSGVYLASIDAPKGHRVVESEAAGVYDGRGRLLFVRQGTLFGQAFDPAKGAVDGSAVPVAERIAVSGGSANVAALSASQSGTVVYRTGSAGELHQLASLDRSGNAIEPPRDLDSAFPQNPTVSPDGRFVVVSRLQNGKGNLWQIDLTRRAPPTPITSDSPQGTYAKWGPDSDRLVFARGPDVFIKSTSTGREEHLINRATIDPNISGPTGRGLTPTDWSRDGNFILLRLNYPKTGFDLVALDLAHDHKIVPVAQGAANEREGQFSPDGKWVAYASDESGRYEIWLKRFPEGTGKYLISTDGGGQVRWRSDGRELYYVALDGRLMAVSVLLGSKGSPEVSAPTPLFLTHIGGAIHPSFHQQYAVAPNGTFIMNNIVDETSSTPITVLLNWHP